MGAYSKGGLMEGGFRICLVAGYIPLRLLYQYATFYVTNPCNRVLSKGHAMFHYLVAYFSSFAL